MDKKTSPSLRSLSPKSPPELPEALGQSESFLLFLQSLSKVAPIDRPVLLIGERGTGKELAAARLHYLSRRWQGPFVASNCSALTPSLLESELFGYEKGAFTGAETRRKGRFESSHGGTLFLDEIGTIPFEVQEKILRAVEYGSFERVGSSERVDVDVRIIAATNADLPALAAAGRFKRDLLDRLSFEVLFLPPLRERKGDILVLAEVFANRMAFELGRKEMPRFSEKALALLEEYPWPGNVRELKNVVERAVYRSDGLRIRDIVFDPFHGSSQPEHRLPKEIPPSATHPFSTENLSEKRPFMEAVRKLEIELLAGALRGCRYNQKKAAQVLGLSYHQFRGLYRKYGRELKTPV